MQSQTEILVFLRLRCHANHTFRGAPFAKSIERRPMRSELRRRAVKGDGIVRISRWRAGEIRRSAELVMLCLWCSQ